MIQKTITSLYNNLIAVQGIYIDKALSKNTDLELIYRGDSMVVSKSQLMNPIKTRFVPD